MAGVGRQIQCVLQPRRAIGDGRIVQSHAVSLSVGASHLEGGGSGGRRGLKRCVGKAEVVDGGGQCARGAAAAENLTFRRQRDPYIECPGRCGGHGR